MCMYVIVVSVYYLISLYCRYALTEKEWRVAISDSQIPLQQHR